MKLNKEAVEIMQQKAVKILRDEDITLKVDTKDVSDCNDLVSVNVDCNWVINEAEKQEMKVILYDYYENDDVYLKMIYPEIRLKLAKNDFVYVCGFKASYSPKSGIWPGGLKALYSSTGIWLGDYKAARIAEEAAKKAELSVDYVVFNRVYIDLRAAGYRILNDVGFD